MSTLLLGISIISRGLELQNFKKQNFSLIFSVIIITIVFTLFYDITTWAFVILYNIILFLIMFRFGDIRLCIMMRMIINLTDTLTYYFTDWQETMLNIGFIAGLVVAAASMFIMIKCADAPEGEPKQA